MEKATKVEFGYEQLAQIIRQSNLTQTNKDKLLFEIRARLPLATRTIKPEEIKDWFKLHSHQQKSAIGGNITKTECYTSIGTMSTYRCSQCQEEAWVDEDF